MSFLKRKIDITFQLGTGSFGNSGFDTIKITGRRVSATITKAGAASMGEVQLTIYGMRLDHMNELSTLGQIPFQVPGQRRNTVIVEAGDDQNGMSVVYVGTIVNAYFNAQAAPETSFNVLAYAGSLEALRPVEPTSVKGPADTATIMGGLAAAANLDFESNNVDVKLPTCYFKGSIRDQMKTCADMANVNWLIDNGKLAIWPKTGSRTNQPVPTISAESGLVGYPTFNVQGVDVVSLFNPAIVFGSSVKIENSILKKANGTWYVYTLYYDLESELPNGKWYTRFLASPPGFVPFPQ